MARPTFEELMERQMRGMVKEIDRRQTIAIALAEKHPELRRETFEEFVEAQIDAGLNLDFITCSEMFDALGGR